jgi:predicted dehydrogenase
VQLTLPETVRPGTTRRPLLAFVGLGWIGRHRMEAIRAADLVDIVALADPDPAAVETALALSPEARTGSGLAEVLDLQPDGVIIATPSARHAAETIAALEAGCAVFCQKPLGRSAGEVRQAVETARRVDRLLAVDLSYRETAALRAIAPLAARELGRVFAVDATFHNAYGPDKPWFYDRALSGGGCLMDLGVHVLDMALRPLGYPEVTGVEAHLFAQGRPATTADVEDYAVATLRLAGGGVIRLACSWKLQAGCDAVISCDFHGTEGGASMRNLDGSFYDFEAYRHHGNRTEQLTAGPDDWGGRAAVNFARRLADGQRFDPAAEELVGLHDCIDRIYAAADLAACRDRV